MPMHFFLFHHRCCPYRPLYRVPMSLLVMETEQICLWFLKSFINLKGGVLGAWTSMGGIVFRTTWWFSMVLHWVSLAFCGLSHCLLLFKFLRNPSFPLILSGFVRLLVRVMTPPLSFSYNNCLFSSSVTPLFSTLTPSSSLSSSQWHPTTLAACIPLNLRHEDSAISLIASPGSSRSGAEVGVLGLIMISRCTNPLRTASIYYVDKIFHLLPWHACSLAGLSRSSWFLSCHGGARRLVLVSMPVTTTTIPIPITTYPPIRLFFHHRRHDNVTGYPSSPSTVYHSGSPA